MKKHGFVAGSGFVFAGLYKHYNMEQPQLTGHFNGPETSEPEKPADVEKSVAFVQSVKASQAYAWTHSSIR